MNQERYSMNHWKPEEVYTKIQRIEAEWIKLDDERSELVIKKKRIEAEFSEANANLRSMTMMSKEWNDANSLRGQLSRKKSEIEIQISELNLKAKRLYAEKESAKIELKKKSNEAIKDNLLAMRDKYMAFSSDNTRVASMRAMSSKFVEEIQNILNIIP